MCEPVEAPTGSTDVMLEVRPALPHEYAAVGELTVAGYRSDGFLDGPSGTEDGYSDELRNAAHRAEHAVLVVAVDSTEVLGTVTWCPIGSPYRELATRPDQGEFRMLAVSPAARRRGVGRALMQWCLRRAREEELREIVLCSLPQMTSAHAMYAALGFVRAPELDWSPAEGVVLWGFRLLLEPVA